MHSENLIKDLRAHVERLAACPRPPRTTAHRETAEYIREHLRGAGFTVEDSQVSEAGYTGLNLLTRPLPDRSSLPLVIVGAHYDSIAESPGADDNASAVAGLLE